MIENKCDIDDTTYAENIDWSLFAIAWTAR